MSAVRLFWNQNTEGRTAQYRVRVLEIGVDMTLDGTQVDFDVPRGTPIHCELTAVGYDGQESAPATLEFTLSDMPPPPPPSEPPPTPSGFSWQEV